MKIMKQVIAKEEGFRSTPYYCSEGYPTVGFGFKIGGKHSDLPVFVISKKVADVWLHETVQDIYDIINKEDWFKNLNDIRQAVIISMAYQLGITGLSKFKRMIECLKEGNYEEASLEMKDSLWAKQTPERASRHGELMKTGKLLEYYINS